VSCSICSAVAEHRHRHHLGVAGRARLEAAFAIDAAGALTPIGHLPSGGRAPGALAIDPSERVLIVANEGGKSLSLYDIDPTTGALGSRHAVALGASPLSVLAIRP
jgi:6-phosphogluconolactonase (cycloisomerase 2 family)